MAPFIPPLRRQRPKNLCELEASLVYKVSSGTPGCCTEKPCLKLKEKKANCQQKNCLHSGLKHSPECHRRRGIQEPTMPLRAASTAPVNAPLAMEFRGSSSPRSWTRLQSMVGNRPPHTAKLPPIWSARILTALVLPLNQCRIPTGALQKLLTAWKTPPPRTPMVKARLQSSTIRRGQGSRVSSSVTPASGLEQSVARVNPYIFILDKGL